ncbi:hypothetical protein M9H77_05422 [Catharanthus roseus]|uniref:Uncharacterized protein n=1 Tax=Catharanthus roseus TaxID=4058 RepID=A0ACC0CHA9_CATRO|nr:hypothetical protein M9H77_05422 [Catharanthus roseus]
MGLEETTPRNASFKLILGSSSIARRQILSEMGYDFTIMTADIDEKSIRKEKPEELVMALAEAKADAIMSRLKGSTDLKKSEKPVLLLTADTVVVYQGIIREKPSSKEEARKFIKDYSGGHTAVVGSVVITNLTNGNRKGDWDRAEVHSEPFNIFAKVIYRNSNQSALCTEIYIIGFYNQ